MEHYAGCTPCRLLTCSHTSCRRWGEGGLEYDQNGPRQTLVDWIKGAGGVSTTFDFPTKGILQVPHGKPQIAPSVPSVVICDDIEHRPHS